jgi:hypothetical protein
VSNCVGICPKLLIIPSVYSRSVGSVIASRSIAPVQGNTYLDHSFVFWLFQIIAILEFQAEDLFIYLQLF